MITDQVKDPIARQALEDAQEQIRVLRAELTKRIEKAEKAQAVPVIQSTASNDEEETSQDTTGTASIPQMRAIQQTTVSENYTVDPDDDDVRVTSAVTIALPETTVRKKPVTIRNKSTGTVTISSPVDGVSNTTIATKTSRTLYPGPEGWEV